VQSKSTMVAASLLALNLMMTKIATTLSLPVYLDTIGTILAAALLPSWMVVLIGVSTSVLASVIVHPAFLYYAVTQAVVALVAVAAMRMNAFDSQPKAIATGLVIAVVAAFVSAPVTVLLFGGVTLGGTTAINAVILATGQTLWKSVLGGSLAIESIDKVVACLLTVAVLRRLPKQFRLTLRRE
jgi:energy-coupling factor transport system substrate-specific component